MTKILLVEDDKSLQEIYGVRLGSEGYNVLIAGDGEEALNIALNEKPDLILSDVMMPKISGFDMLDILRSTPGIKDTKVIIMTALSSDDQRERGEKLGADVYLVKSQVGIEDVVQAVKNLLEDEPANNQLSAEEISEAAAQEATNQPLPTEPTEADFEQAKTELRNDIFQTPRFLRFHPTPSVRKQLPSITNPLPPTSRPLRLISRQHLRTSRSLLNQPQKQNAFLKARPSQPNQPQNQLIHPKTKPLLTRPPSIRNIANQRLYAI